MHGRVTRTMPHKSTIYTTAAQCNSQLAYQLTKASIIMFALVAKHSRHLMNYNVHDATVVKYEWMLSEQNAAQLVSISIFGTIL